MFRVFDYTDATRLLGEEFRSRAATVTEAGAGPAIEGDEEGEDGVRVIAVEGLIAKIVDGGRFVLMNQDGRDLRMPIEEYRAKLAAELKAEAPDPATFRGIWIEPPRRRTLIDRRSRAGCRPACSKRSRACGITTPSRARRDGLWRDAAHARRPRRALRARPRCVAEPDAAGRARRRARAD